MFTKTLPLLIVAAFTCVYTVGAEPTRSSGGQGKSGGGKAQSATTQSHAGHCGNGGASTFNRGTGQGQALNATATGTLTNAERRAMELAIEDEYKARAIYAQVIADFGQVRPFSNIIHAETQHIQALAGLFQKYGLPVPRETSRGKTPTFRSLKDAAAGAVRAEIENAALYDDIMKTIDKPDVLRVFEALQRASLQNHLPAFQRYLAQGSSGSGKGRSFGVTTSSRGSGNGKGMRYGQSSGSGYRGGRGQSVSSGSGRGSGSSSRSSSYGTRSSSSQGKGQGRGQGNGQGSRGKGRR